MNAACDRCNVSATGHSRSPSHRNIIHIKGGTSTRRQNHTPNVQVRMRDDDETSRVNDDKHLVPHLSLQLHLGV